MTTALWEVRPLLRDVVALGGGQGRRDVLQSRTKCNQIQDRSEAVLHRSKRGHPLGGAAHVQLMIDDLLHAVCCSHSRLRSFGSSAYCCAIESLCGSASPTWFEKWLTRGACAHGVNLRLLCPWVSWWAGCSLFCAWSPSEKLGRPSCTAIRRGALRRIRLLQSAGKSKENLVEAIDALRDAPCATNVVEQSHTSVALLSRDHRCNETTLLARAGLHKTRALLSPSHDELLQRRLRQKIARRLPARVTGEACVLR